MVSLLSFRFRFGPLWCPFGFLWFPSGFVLAPFGLVLVAFGSPLVFLWFRSAVYSLKFSYGGLLFKISLWCRGGGVVSSFFRVRVVSSTCSTISYLICPFRVVSVSVDFPLVPWRRFGVPWSHYFVAVVKVMDSLYNLY